MLLLRYCCWQQPSSAASRWPLFRGAGGQGPEGAEGIFRCAEKGTFLFLLAGGSFLEEALAPMIWFPDFLGNLT